MKLGSLCSGAGGLDMAVESVFGAETVWHCELDPAASKVLAHRWPGVPNHGDLISTDWEQVEPVDIMCAGWPCQPFSQAGKRLGAKDERALWPYIAGAVRMVRPRIVVLENVSAVLAAGEFQRVADDLAQAGYEFAWVCVRASDVGAPHRRERVFIVAHAGSLGNRGSATDAERFGCDSGIGGPSLEKVQTGGSRNGNGAVTADASGDGRHEGRPEPARFVGRSDAAVSGDGPVNLLPTPRTTDAHGAGEHGNGGMDLRTTVTLLSTPQARDHKGRPADGFNTANLCRDVALLQTPSVADALGGHLTRSGKRRDEPLLPGQAREMATAWGKYEPAIRRWEHLTRPAPAPTEPNRNGKPRLVPAFSEWMMGWPAGWVTNPAIGISHDDQLRIIGNGVVPQQACAALSWLLSLEMVA